MIAVKHFLGQHHVAVRPWYMPTPSSPRVLPRAHAPSALIGCAGTLDNGYGIRIPTAGMANPISGQTGQSSIGVPLTGVLTNSNGHGFNHVHNILSFIISEFAVNDDGVRMPWGGASLRDGKEPPAKYYREVVCNVSE